jgi:hypothetical protein
MREAKPLQLIKKPNLLLRKQHAALYALITENLAKNKSITYEEAKELWINHACRNIINGIPHTYNFWWRPEGVKEPVGRYEPMTNYAVKMTVLEWLTRGIGILVLKGFLKIIPMIEIT